MAYIVIIFAIISVILVLISKFYGLSIIYPTLMIILTIILDIISNVVKSKKEQKEKVNLEEIKNGGKK